ncbi:MAG TPA: efflux RND transporter periplasmic adaptor subunit [Bryobacteraceae bacterium]|nr:efflux RND transporter periplasmic adaptor subunit [Bryobacteraceae bacterium]
MTNAISLREVSTKGTNLHPLFPGAAGNDLSEERVLKKMARVLKILAPISLISVLALAGCTDSNEAAQVSGSGALKRAKDNSAVPVVVSKAGRSSFPVELRSIGTGQAFKTVSVESQVAGIVKEVHYRQGQLIHQGDLLITMDKSPFLAALAQAEAALAKDKAQAQLSRAELQRYSELDKQGIISKEQYEQSVATSTAARATVQADEAAIQTAKIQLSYCSIYAPISGVAGAQLVYPGATVKANDVPVLVVINQVSPIYVDFAVPQQYLGSIKSFMARSHLEVQATPPGYSVAEKGILTFVNNTVDSSTGTIHLLASFPNTDQRLWPGQFSDVLLRLNEEQNVLVIPSQAVQTGQQGDYVFVTKPDMTVEVRQVKVGQSVNNQTQVLQGLSEGETVVIDGQVRLVPGTKVYFSKGL